MDANKLWISAKQKLKGSFPKSFFEIYFNEESIPIAVKDHVFYLRGNIRTKEFFENQKKDKLLEAFSELAANINDVVVITDLDEELAFFQTVDEENARNSAADERTELISKASNIANANLNPKYTFDTFVVGPSNNIAVAACQRVASSDDIMNDNPLFLYGGVGLGKTHLMHAIGHNVLERDPSKKVLYVSSETFTNELIMAIREKKNDEFRHKYRSVDLFMIDDVQFIAGKTSVEEELFHTFNDVFAAGKKIILSSDRPPRDIPHLKDRLKSRFICGIMVDIQAPDYSTRMAILQSKAENDNLSIPKDVIEYIADNVKSNIRELEGALNKVILYADLSSQELNLDTAKEALKDILVSYKTKEINVLRIKEMVSDAYNVTVEELNSKKRTKNIAFPRQVAMYISRTLLDISLPNIGDEFGGRDHTTVMHAIKKIEDEMEKSEMTKVKIEKIISDLNG
ncbi:chromosomal replication initiator protein DnaA [Peptostreptococcus russellii]|uniref:Chromosomal replication initiator protein DnaA n=1 Tax=Peptostreptococcus russellii TaxID=215200 RepID=A0A1H8K7H3_9FIRM|nr:chromosomal replication initiator protein DnaA [Peptostreptococcus russellii]MBC2576920.1 chromosomal replication initiator protein DnaA [Peptostreptococcus russellii]SEN88942.1 chromosomal replication initiator protein DnaA [Peptostreptococcus russellii]